MSFAIYKICIILITTKDSLFGYLSTLWNEKLINLTMYDFFRLSKKLKRRSILWKESMI